MNNTYSFIMNFRGGTYIKQATASTLKKAIELWATNLDTKEIEYLSQKTKQQLINDLPEMFIENEFTPIETVKNVWIFCYTFKTGYATIHVIKTDISNEPIN